MLVVVTSGSDMGLGGSVVLNNKAESFQYFVEEDSRDASLTVQNKLDQSSDCGEAR
jgi:hypothetical protein